jgi:predicted Fe-Mo cluster-binding NifX family protein
MIYISVVCSHFIGTSLANHIIMKIAIPQWKGRISPVLDEASKVLLVEIKDHLEQHRQENTLIPSHSWARAQVIRQLGAEILICGAVSRQLEAALRSAGIQVISNICGPVEAVLSAFREGRLDENVFLMPGCCGRRRRFRGGDHSNS